MNDNHEKDPFAEYDKYWDQSDEQKDKEEPEDHYFQSRDFQNNVANKKPHEKTFVSRLLFMLHIIIIFVAFMIGTSGYVTIMKTIIISLIGLDVLSIVIAIIIRKRSGGFFK